MTAQTPIYGFPYLEPGQPVRDTRQVLEDATFAWESVLATAGAVPPDSAEGTHLATPNTWARRGPAGQLEVRPAATAAEPYQKAQVDTLLGALPINDELFTGQYMGHMTAQSYHVFVAPFALRVAGVSLMTWTAVASAATVRFQMELRRARAGALATFATKTTYAGDGAGGQAIATNTDWNFDNIAFTSSVAQFNKGDGLLFRIVVPAGSTSPIAQLDHCSVTVRYVPL